MGMGIFGAIGGMAAQSAVNAAAETAAREALKKGKTPDQKKAIDYLYDVDLGCLSFLKSKPFTSQEYIEYVNRLINSANLYEKAINKIGLDPSQIQEIPPIVLTSFVFDDDCLIRVDNNVALSSQYSITWIFFSDSQMYTYKYIFDTTSDNTWEFTNDFFYGDITCFSTSHALKEKIKLIPAKGCGCLKGKDEYAKSHYTVDTLEVIVPGTSYSIALTNSTTVEQSIQAAKAMLREKKYMK